MMVVGVGGIFTICPWKHAGLYLKKKKKKALEKGIKRQFYGLWDIYAKY